MFLYPAQTLKFSFCLQFSSCSPHKSTYACISPFPLFFFHSATCEGVHDQADCYTYAVHVSDSREVTFDDAQTLCRQHDGIDAVIPTITSAHQQKRVEEAISQSAARNSSYLWTGMQFRAENGDTYVDKKNLSLPFLHFAAQKASPPNTTLNCVLWSKAAKYFWVWTPCGATTRLGQGAVCVSTHHAHCDRDLRTPADDM